MYNKLFFSIGKFDRLKYWSLYERALNLINTILEINAADTEIVSYLCFYELKIEISHIFVSFTVLVFMVLFLYTHYFICFVVFWFFFYLNTFGISFEKNNNRILKNLLNCSKYSSTLCDLTRKMAKNTCWPPNCPIRTEVSWDYFHR